MKKFDVKIRDRRGPPQSPPDPRYPQGVHPDMSQGRMPTCVAKLPYPAPERCILHVVCNRCGRNVALTAAGRPDDPVTVRLACSTGTMKEGDFR